MNDLDFPATRRRKRDNLGGALLAALPLTVRHADASAIASIPAPIAARPSPDGLHRALAAAAAPAKCSGARCQRK